MKQKLKKQKKIRFKVVKASSRYSCMVHGASKYALKYDPETEVHARPETLGVMCFDTYKSAKRLIHTHYYYRENCMIVKVIPMGRGSSPLTMGSPSQLVRYYEHDDWYRSLIPPDGTICYPAVYVVD